MLAQYAHGSGDGEVGLPHDGISAGG
jgi:hypothetical protein